MADDKRHKRPILVTGSHRSGTTWVGNIMSSSPVVCFINEPFGINCRPGVCSAGFKYWFQYISDQNYSMFYHQLYNTIQMKYNLKEELKTLSSKSDVARMIKDIYRFYLCKYRKARPLLKDPIALFSAEWLAETFDMDVIVLIRHPAAFASSLKRLKWSHPFSHFVNQPLLMKEHLVPFEREIREYAVKERNIIDQAILLWKIIHYVIIKYRRAHDDWTFIRHEDISREPLDKFRMLFERVGLEFSPDVQRNIEKLCGANNPTEVSVENVYCLRRNSRSNIWNWKKRLSVSEIERIRKSVEDISKDFYSDEDW